MSEGFDRPGHRRFGFDWRTLLNRRRRLKALGTDDWLNRSPGLGLPLRDTARDRLLLADGTLLKHGFVDRRGR